MRQSSKTLFEAVGVDLQWAMFVRAASFALTTRAALPAEVPKHLRNRVAWVEAFATAQGSEPTETSSALLALEPALRFYWSFRDGTGDVERSLGRFFPSKEPHGFDRG